MVVPDELFALSVRQPWLDMIVRGVKTMELRSWEVRRRGVVALHGPMRIDFGAAYFFGYQTPWHLPRGGIVALAEIAEVRSLAAETWEDTLSLHRQPVPMLGGAYGVLFTNVQALVKQVPCRGRQMLFPLDSQTISKIRAAGGV
jgi:hypothetical protein